MALPALRILDVGYGRGANAELFGYTPARVSLNWMFTDISQPRHSQGLMIW